MQSGLLPPCWKEAYVCMYKVSFIYSSTAVTNGVGYSHFDTTAPRNPLLGKFGILAIETITIIHLCQELFPKDPHRMHRTSSGSLQAGLANSAETQDSLKRAGWWWCIMKLLERNKHPQIQKNVTVSWSKFGHYIDCKNQYILDGSSNGRVRTGEKALRAVPPLGRWIIFEN